MIGGGIIAVIVLGALFAPVLAPGDPEKMEMKQRLAAWQGSRWRVSTTGDRRRVGDGYESGGVICLPSRRLITDLNNLMPHKLMNKQYFLE